MFLVLRMRFKAVRKVDLAQAIQATYSRHILVREVLIFFVRWKQLLRLRVDGSMLHQGFEPVVRILLPKLRQTLVEPFWHRRL